MLALGEGVAEIYRDESPSLVELPFTARPGGAPANVVVVAARLGVEAAFAGAVGKDLFGDFILRALEAEGVSTSGVRRREPSTRTSLAFVEIGEDGDRSFTFYRLQNESAVVAVGVRHRPLCLVEFPTGRRRSMFRSLPLRLSFSTLL